MKIIDSTPQLVPADPTYAILAHLEDSGSEYIVIVNRKLGICHLEEVVEKTGLSGNIQYTQPVAQWTMTEDETTASVETGYSKEDVRNIIHQVLSIEDNDGYKLLSPQKIWVASKPGRKIEDAPKGDIYIPAVFGGPFILSFSGEGI